MEMLPLRLEDAALESIKDQLVLFEVVHSIPGRIRVRVPLLSQFPTLYQDLETELNTLEFVSEVRVVSVINSITLSYDLQETSETSILLQFYQTINKLLPPGILFVNSLRPKSTPSPFTDFEVLPLSDFETNLQDFLNQLWDDNRQTVLSIVGVTSIAIGIILVPLPLVPGTPLILLGSYCLSLTTTDNFNNSI